MAESGCESVSLWLRSPLPFYSALSPKKGWDAWANAKECNYTVSGNTVCRFQRESARLSQVRHGSDVVWEFFHRSNMVEDTIYGITQFLFIEIYLSSSESKAKKYFRSPGQVCILPFISSPKKKKKKCNSCFPFCPGCQDTKT